MRQKLYLGFFVILLAIFAKALDHDTSPNQQIIIQFSDLDANAVDADYTIDGIRNRLSSLGAEKIEIGRDTNGHLKITYYSSIAIKQIKNILSKDQGFSFTNDANGSNPRHSQQDRSVLDYELNISEIQNSGNTNWDFNGIQVVELNQKSDRFSYPKTNNSGQQICLELGNQLIKVAVNTNNSNVLVLDTHSYKIPEVRAGPNV
jgi:hypothetical protein